MDSSQEKELGAQKLAKLNSFIIDRIIQKESRPSLSRDAEHMETEISAIDKHIRVVCSSIKLQFSKNCCV